MPRDVTHARGAFDLKASTGLFVGVSDFEDSRLHTVPFAVDDAVDLAHVFTLELGLILPENIVLLLAGEPRKLASVERLERLIKGGARRQGARMRDIYYYLSELARRSDAKGLFILTVATHGVSDQGGDFLVATDSLRERTLRTGVAVAEVFDEVARAGAERRLVLLDACRERINQGTRGTEESAMRQSFADAIAQAKGSVVLSGATLGGFAYDDPERKNGVFTAAVLDGLHGEASAGPEGWITIHTLADFVKHRVTQWVRRNRLDHLVRAQGIELRIDSDAIGLPLALHPQAKKRKYKKEPSVKPQERDWQRSLLDYLGTQKELFKASGCSDADLVSLHRRLSDLTLSSDDALNIIESFISKLSLHLTLAYMEDRLESEVSVVCSRGCVPINLIAIDFYTDAAKLVDRWAKEFFDKHVSSINLLLWDIRKVASKRIIQKLADFLSSKMAILVADWRAEVLHRQCINSANEIIRQLSIIVETFRKTAAAEAARLEISYLHRLTFSDISNSVFAAWIENRVTNPWLTLFSPLYLDVAQLSIIRTGGTPREILKTIIAKEIIENGQRQELSVPKDIARFVLFNCFSVSLDGDYQKILHKPSNQTLLKELEKSRLAVISLMM